MTPPKIPKGKEAQPQWPEKPWARSTREVLEALEVSAEKGLAASEVRRRIRQYGFNLLREAKTKSAWRILAEQFKSLMAVLLAAAGALAFVLGDWLEGMAILAVILINGVLGFFTELRAVRSMEALSRLTRVSAKVRRGGEIQEISAKELVPGDMVVLEGGDIVSADLRLIRASKAQADESALTGESAPGQQGRQAFSDWRAAIAKRRLNRRKKVGKRLLPS